MEKLKEKYLDISETMNATVYLDKLPTEKTSGLVIKISDFIGLSDEDKAYFPANFKVSGEAKPIELDTRRIDEKIAKLDESLGELRNKKVLRETCISELNKMSASLEQELRNQEISLANKESSHATVQEQFNKIKEEEDVIVMELTELQREIATIGQNLVNAQMQLSSLNSQQRQKQDLIVQEEDTIALNSRLREEVLVLITQTKTEIEALHKRFTSDESTLKILDETYAQDKESLENIARQASESKDRQEVLKVEIGDCQKKIAEAEVEIQLKKEILSEVEEKYNAVSSGTTGVMKKIEAARLQLEQIKNQLHDLQM